MRLFFVSLVFIIATHNVSAQLIHGTYNYGKPKKEHYGVLQLHQTKAGNYLFYLEVGGGAPNFNTGALYDKITFNKTSGRYEANTKGCLLQFLPDAKGVAIRQVKGDCGFPYGVVATGTYIAKNRRNPSSLTTSTGKKVDFKKTPPEAFRGDLLH
jgi:hypothetical protein